jgi:imidazolonepropionase-like amidohydrolase
LRFVINRRVHVVRPHLVPVRHLNFGNVEHLLRVRVMVVAGLSTFDILKWGTASVGQDFKAQDDFGTIAAGKRADMLLVDANPLQSIDNVAKQSE